MPETRETADVLRSPEAGALVIRGGAVRSGGYGISLLLAAATSVFLLRYLGVDDFGVYGVVVALLGIVAALTEGGLSIVGSRDLAVLPAGPRREALLANLVTLRVVLTGCGVLVAALFAVAVGYESVIVVGTLLAGVGVVLLNLQVTLSLPLRIGLRLGAVTTVETLNQALTLVLVAGLVALAAPLVAFFGVQVVVGAVAIVVTLALVGFGAVRPGFQRETMGQLVRETLPLAAAVAMNVVYLRMLLILVSLFAGATATGLFATSSRVLEMLIGLPTLVLSIALPLLAVHVASDRARFAYGFQRLTEIALLLGLLQALLTAVVAEPALVLLGGEEYRDAAPLLVVQSAALVPVYLAQAWTLGLVALRRQRLVAVANLAALSFAVVGGIWLVSAYDAMGAAAAGVATESLLALALFVLLARSDREVTPGLLFAWRPLAAGGAAFAVALALDLNGWVELPIVAAVFLGVAFATRAVPAEVLPALAGFGHARARGQS